MARSTLSKAKANAAPHGYATRAAISRTIQAARANGINVAAVECRPNGAIRVSTAECAIPASETEFGIWAAAGKL